MVSEQFPRQNWCNLIILFGRGGSAADAGAVSLGRWDMAKSSRVSKPRFSLGVRRRPTPHASRSRRIPLRCTTIASPAEAGQDPPNGREHLRAYPQCARLRVQRPELGNPERAALEAAGHPFPRQSQRLAFPAFGRRRDQHRGCCLFRRQRGRQGSAEFRDLVDQGQAVD